MSRQQTKTERGSAGRWKENEFHAELWISLTPYIRYRWNTKLKSGHITIMIFLSFIVIFQNFISNFTCYPFGTSHSPAATSSSLFRTTMQICIQTHGHGTEIECNNRSPDPPPPSIPPYAMLYMGTYTSSAEQYNEMANKWRWRWQLAVQPSR